MNTKQKSRALVMALLIAAAAPLHAGKKELNGPSLTNGYPPPDNAVELPIRKAVLMLRQSLRHSCLTDAEFAQSSHFTHPAIIHVDRDQLEVSLGLSCYGGCVTSKQEGIHEERLLVRFKDAKNFVRVAHCYLPDCQDVSVVYADHLEKRTDGSEGPLWYNDHRSAWYVKWINNRAAAQDFVNAFNRLAYASYRAEPATTSDEDLRFRSAAQAWRENPAKPPLGPEADRHRVLAENAIKEKNLDSAVDHYENVLELQPAWPAGWFNLALIYAEQNNYADAVDCMKRYLELAPDAPDAKAARDQLVIWEDKSKR